MFPLHSEQVDFPLGQGTFSAYLSGGQVIRRAIGQLINNGCSVPDMCVKEGSQVKTLQGLLPDLAN